MGRYIPIYLNMAEAIRNQQLRPIDVFVGRRDELEWLRSTVDQAAGGQGCVVMLSGDPGIGKTRTAHEISSRARESNMDALWGHCYDGEGAPPYWPWVQIIRSFIDGWHPEKLRRCLGNTAGVIARIVPDFEDRLGEIPAPPELGNAEAERFRLFDSVARFLNAAARERPLLIVLDDLHWSDDSSLRLLEFVCRGLSDQPIIVIGTYRDEELRSSTLATLGNIRRIRQFEHIALSGFSKSEVGQLIELSTGGEPPLALVDAIFARTDGNPMFASEVIRYLGVNGRLSALTAAKQIQPHLHIPGEVREVIKKRLSKLSADCIEYLHIAALVGREFDGNVVWRVLENDDSSYIEDATSEALTNRIIEPFPGSSSGYKFCHHLVQESLVVGLSSTARAELHAKIALMLEAIYADDVDSHAAELAYQFAGAKDITGTNRVVRYSLIAGKDAVHRCAYENAISIYQRAIETVKNEPLDDDTAELYLAYANAQFLAMEVDEVLAAAAKVFDYYEITGQVAGLAKIIGLIACTAPFRTGREEVSPRKYYGRALKLFDDNPIDDPKTLYTMSELRLFVSGNFEEAEKLVERAYEVARERGDAASQREALRRWAYIECTTGRAYSSVKRHELAVSIKPEIENLYEDWSLYLEFVAADLQTGDPKAAERHVNLKEKAARALGLPRFMPSVYSSKHLLASKTGDWHKARLCFDEGIRFLEQWGGSSPDRFWLVGRAALTEYEVGNFDVGEGYMDLLLSSRHDPDAPNFVNNIILNTLVPGVLRIAESEEWLDLAAELAESRLSKVPWKWRPASFMGLIAAFKNDGTAAGKWYEKLFSRKLEIGGFLGHSLGIVARAAGRVEDAFAHFEEGYVFCRGAGYLPDLAWICRDYAETLASRGKPGDLERARILLDEGLSITEKLGMAPLKKKLETLRDETVQPPKEQRNGLTNREVEVLELIARGMTNQEVGYELSVSDRTVAAHLRNIFEKVGAANRAEAAVYAIRNGILTKGDT